MPVEIFENIEQGSDTWRELRRGIPTASRFSHILSKAKGGEGDSATRETYLNQLVAEVVTETPVKGYQDENTLRGTAEEPQIRAEYSVMFDVRVRQVAFIRNGETGYSPDGLIGEDGGVEFKSAAPHVMVGILRHSHADRGWSPPKHYAQVQGGLWVSEREWIDLVIACPGFPLFRKRIVRDPKFIVTLAKAVDAFNDEKAAVVEMVRGYVTEG